MRIFGRPVPAVIAVVSVVLLWAGFAYQVSRPADAREYLRTAMQVAESAHDAAVTGALIGRRQLEDQVFGAFAVTAYGDAAKGLAGAAGKIAGPVPPDAASARLRDRLLALLQAATRELGDAAAARTDPALRAAVAGLDAVGVRLAALIERQR
ncbi:hypothetical protein [Actinoplanes sp. NPDC026623]|uniref:hypothetical protein n=1 Tax=Actinoplanes sp. NPDC026623 TaxID=3155610 RepID=UPI0033DD1D98